MNGESPQGKRLVDFKGHRFLGASERWSCVDCGRTTTAFDEALVPWCSAEQMGSSEGGA